MLLKKLREKLQYKWKVTNLYDALEPLHYATKLTGLAPFKRVKNDGLPVYEVSLLGVCYSYTWILLFVAYYVFAVEERNKIGYVQNNKVANTIEMYQLYGAVVVMTLCVFCNSFKQQILIEACKYLQEIDKRILQNNRNAIDYVRTRNYILCYVAFVFSLCGGMEFMNCSMFLRGIDTFSTFCLLMCYVPLLLNGLVECQFVTFVCLLRQRFAYVNDGLTKIATRRERLTSKFDGNIGELLFFYRNVHWDLCQVGRTFNKSFNVQSLIIICNVFVSFTTLSYYAFDSFVEIDLEDGHVSLYDSVTTTIWSLVKLAQLLVLSIACSSLRRKANMAKDIVYKIRNPNVKVYDEVVTFGCQMLHWNFRLTAFDFFNIDMTLFYSVICSATTYLMILLQLDMANRQLENDRKTNEY